MDISQNKRSRQYMIECTSCEAQRNELHARTSRLMKNHKLFLCAECDKNKREPRYLIILVGRARGPEAVSDYIKNHRYVGKEILASELIV